MCDRRRARGAGLVVGLGTQRGLAAAEVDRDRHRHEQHQHHRDQHRQPQPVAARHLLAGVGELVHGRETAAARADVVEGPVLVTAGHHRPGVRARVARLAGLLGEQRALRWLLERRWRRRRLVAGAQPGDLVVLVVEDRQAGLGGGLHDRVGLRLGLRFGLGSGSGSGSSGSDGGAQSSGCGRARISGTAGSTTVSFFSGLPAAIAGPSPVGSPTKSARKLWMPRALARSRASPSFWPRGLSSSSHRSSRPLGTPARTCRGRSTRPCFSGARGTPDGETPAQRPVRVACSRPARSTTSRCGSPGGRPCSAASTQKPMIRTEPLLSSSTFSGESRPWATPCACAAAIESATSLTIHAPRRGESGPLLASMMSSEVPDPHSLTTKQQALVRSASSTRRMRGSRTVAERRAASRSSSARGSSAAITWRATCRSRMRSWARQNRPPPLSLSRSTSRYRSASTSPARVACGTVVSTRRQLLAARI